MLCDNRPIERVSLCVSADQAPERREKVRISIAVNAPMHVQSYPIKLLFKLLNYLTI